MHPIFKKHGWLAKQAFLAPVRYFQNHFWDSLKVIWYCFCQKPKATSIRIKELDHLLVISRYQENIDWLSDLNLPTLVYNKGKKVIGSNDLWVENLINIGRESHTFIHFIIANYNQLPKRVTFLQADPFEHYPQIKESLNKVDQFMPVQALSIRYLPKYHKQLKKLATFNTGNPNEEKILKFIRNKEKVPFYVEELDQRLNLIWPEHFVDPYMQNTKFLHTHGDEALAELFNRISLQKPQRVFFNYGGLFSVEREKILQHNLEFYKNLMIFLLEDLEHGFLLERLWLSIFGFEFES